MGTIVRNGPVVYSLAWTISVTTEGGLLAQFRSLSGERPMCLYDFVLQVLRGALGATWDARPNSPVDAIKFASNPC